MIHTVAFDSLSDWDANKKPALDGQVVSKAKFKDTPSITGIVVFLQQTASTCLSGLANGLMTLAERVGNVDWSMEDTP